MTYSIAQTEATRLGERIRETREYLGLSQQFVSDQTGIPRSAVSDIERGRRKVNSIELKRLANLFRYPVDYFLGEETAPGATDETLHALARAAEDLTDQDRKEVLRFAEFLRNYSSISKRKSG